jgi:hypothetical protein
MSIPNHFPRQIEAFHAGFLDNCNRAASPAESDTMVLRLRANAVALAKVQLAMVAMLRAEQPQLVATASHHMEEAWAADCAAGPDRASPTRPDEIPTILAPDDAALPDQPPAAVARPTLAHPSPPQDDREDRVITGDVLSRFVSHRLMPEESPHEVWQSLQEAEPAKQRRNPALPGAGFRSSSR